MHIPNFGTFKFISLAFDFIKSSHKFSTFELKLLQLKYILAAR